MRSRRIFTYQKSARLTLVAFKFLAAKAKKKSFVKPILNVRTLDKDKAFMDVVNYVQYNRFETAVDLLKNESPDAFDSIWKRIGDRATSAQKMSRIAEPKVCVICGPTLMLILC